MSTQRMKRRKPYFSISAVSNMFDVHQQTIRLYEKEGLIQPERTEGGTRMFSEEDVEKLEEIIYLTHQLGVNIAGVEVIFKMQKKMKKMQKEMNKIFANTHNELSQETNTRKELIQAQSKQLNAMKTDQTNPYQYDQTDSISFVKNPQTTEKSSFNDWDIDYEE